MSTKFTLSVGLDLTTIVCVSLSGAIAALLYAIANGWLSL